MSSENHLYSPEIRLTAVLLEVQASNFELASWRQPFDVASRASPYSAIEGRSRKCGGGVGPIASFRERHRVTCLPTSARDQLFS